MADDRAKIPPPPLSGLWEGELSLRAKARENQCLTTWANPRVIGVASTGAMSLNIKALEILGEWWACQMDMPQAIPIDIIRQQARSSQLFYVQCQYVYFG